MIDLYARSVFFVDDAERALTFYLESLGFAVDWRHDHEGRTIVGQVSLFGFQLILNETYGSTVGHAGHGRVFIGLDHDQVGPFRAHIAARGIATSTVSWGRPTLVIRDLDGNELFFWPPEDDATEPEPGPAP